MFELSDSRPKFEVPQAEFNRLLGYPRGRRLEGRSAELAADVRAWYAAHGRPWLSARQVMGVELREGRVRVAGLEFASVQLHQQLAAGMVQSVVLVAVSAGPECEAQAQLHWREEKPDEYFFTEMYGSAVVEHLVTVVAGQLCAWADQRQMAALPHYSPGYAGWDVTDQSKIWTLLHRGRAQPLPGQLEVMPSGMLRPKKSLLALFGLTTRLEQAKQLSSLIPCQRCPLEPCQYRRAPYHDALAESEEVEGGRASACEEPGLASLSPPRLEQAVKYSVNTKALRKWSKERLRLERLPDSSIRAWFRYDGTTCSNMGRPLAFDYCVRLAPPGERYRIVELACAPSAGDPGYQSMCEYLRDGASLMSKLESERPLLGRPLEEVLHWQRAASPSGCYCQSEMRMHKWGLVFEVLHYALAGPGSAPDPGHHPLPAAATR